MTKRKTNYGKIAMRSLSDIFETEKFEKRFNKDYFRLFKEFNDKPLSEMTLTDRRLFLTFLKVAMVEAYAQATFGFTSAMLGAISEGLPLLARNMHSGTKDLTKLKDLENKLKSIRREQAKLVELYDGIEDIKTSFEGFIQGRMQQIEQAEPTSQTK